MPGPGPHITETDEEHEQPSLPPLPLVAISGLPFKAKESDDDDQEKEKEGDHEDEEECKLSFPLFCSKMMIMMRWCFLLCRVPPLSLCLVDFCALDHSPCLPFFPHFVCSTIMTSSDVQGSASAIGSKCETWYSIVSHRALPLHSFEISLFQPSSTSYAFLDEISGSLPRIGRDFTLSLPPILLRCQVARIQGSPCTDMKACRSNQSEFRMDSWCTVNSFDFVFDFAHRSLHANNHPTRPFGLDECECSTYHLLICSWLSLSSIPFSSLGRPFPLFSLFCLCN